MDGGRKFVRNNPGFCAYGLNPQVQKIKFSGNMMLNKVTFHFILELKISFLNNQTKATTSNKAYSSFLAK